MCRVRSTRGDVTIKANLVHRAVLALAPGTSLVAWIFSTDGTSAASHAVQTTQLQLHLKMSSPGDLTTMGNADMANALNVNGSNLALLKFSMDKWSLK